MHEHHEEDDVPEGAALMPEIPPELNVHPLLLAVLHATVFVQVQRDLGVAFDARHRIDDDGVALLHEISLFSY